ncbi:MAG: TolC family protein [Acidobacteria bacterium]|nr:TolC family protein [Acidobacteriota bacterium]
MHFNKTLAVALATTLFVQPLAVTAQEYHRSKIDYSSGADTWPNFMGAFEIPDVPQVNLANSNRLEQLLRDGNLYLSLSDALALAIENNLDLELARYNPLVAATDVLRAKSGQQLRGVQTQISTLSTGNSVGGGGGAQQNQVTGITQRAGGGGDNGGGGSTGDASSFFGTQAVSLDPQLFGNLSWGHFSSPQTSDFVTGTNSYVNEQTNSNLGIRQGFLTGATASLTWANTQLSTNSRRNNFDPNIRSNVTLSIRQPLMRGFGLAVNSRNIVVAKRNQEISDLAFQDQLITIVVRVQQLYWDLVSLRANAEAQREALGLAQKLYEDNKRRVEIGTLAPIEIVRAEAEVATREEGLTVAETQVRVQETLIKNALSKNGLASPSLLQAHIIPTDRITVPPVEDLGSIEEMMESAVRIRVDVQQARVRLGNADINLKAIRNGRLPQLTLAVDVTNNGLAGQINDHFVGTDAANPFFLGGMGNALGQIFRRNFPDYSVGVNMTIPIRNRQAQADLAATLLLQRQSEIQIRQTENSVRAQVQNAVIGVEQARARFQTTVKSRELQERTLEAEQKKFDLGASTIFLVVQAQRDLALAKSAEIAAMNNYVIAKIELDRATGETLAANDISMAEAQEGVVNRPASALP